MRENGRLRWDRARSESLLATPKKKKQITKEERAHGPDDSMRWRPTLCEEHRVPSIGHGVAWNDVAMATTKKKEEEENRTKTNRENLRIESQSRLGCLLLQKIGARRLDEPMEKVFIFYSVPFDFAADENKMATWWACRARLAT